MTDLKPCPFCGGSADRITITDEDEVSNVGGDVICCTKCDSCTRVFFGEKEGIEDAWNTRADLATECERKLVEALVAECDIYLKEGETPRQRMDRDHLDILALGKMLADDRKRRDEAEARVETLTEALEFYADRGFDGYDVGVTDYGLSIEAGEIIKDGGELARAALQENTDDR